jgi:hypothetical protein
MSDEMPITPETRVHALLERYPELEDVLIDMAPAFKKLRNPLLRRSVAKVASLKQAAAVGRIPAQLMVNELRMMVGQPALDAQEPVDADSYFGPQPHWFDASRVVDSLDEAELDPDVMPLRPLMLHARSLEPSEVLELVTAYLPAPAIDILRRKGFASWSVEDGDVVNTYFSKLED